VAVEPQVFDLLAYLIRNRDQVVTKDDLLKAVWNRRMVSDSAVTTRINAVRCAIGDNGQSQRLIRTLPRKGFRFVGKVNEEQAPLGNAARTTSPESNALASQDDPPAGPRLDREPPRLTLPERPSIAVLPFMTMSNDPEQANFADGIVDDIITALSHLRWLFVIARTSTFAYKHRAVDVKQVGRELGVRYVLEGSIRKASDRLRISAQLIEAEHGTHVWARRYERSLKDIFAVQDEITDSVAAALEPEISAAERDRARRKAPESLGAWEIYQHGMWHLLRHNHDEVAKAQGYFSKAAEMDPTFAAPHAALAIAGFHQITRMTTDDPAASLTNMFSEASRAITLDPKDSLGHTALGLAFMERGEFAHSIAEHEIAVTLNCNSSYAHWSFGYVLLRADRLDEALKQFEIALRLNPMDPARWSYLTLKASTLYRLKRYREATACAYEATRNETADLIWPYTHLAAALGQLGRTSEAKAAVTELLRRKPGLTISAMRSWPHNQRRSQKALEHLVDGMRKAGLPE
jgi:TolB-like protein/Tfp pilus assembly protein PilF